MPGFSGPQAEQWLATLDVILGDKLYLVLQTCLRAPETEGEVHLTHSAASLTVSPRDTRVVSGDSGARNLILCRH